MTICMYNVICVTSRKLCEEDFLTRIEKICNSGIKSLILREKDLSAEDYRQLAEKVVSVCHKYGTECILHSHMDIATELNADGVHLTMDMLRNLQEKHCKTGVSCHSVSEAVEAEKMGADYIIAGHIFETDCKKGFAPRGLDFLKEVCESVDIPVYGIGGINKDNIESVINAGASGGCIMSGLMRGDISEY